MLFFYAGVCGGGKEFGCLEVRVRGGLGLFKEGARNWTQILCKRTAHNQPYCTNPTAHILGIA